MFVGPRDFFPSASPRKLNFSPNDAPACPVWAAAAARQDKKSSEEVAPRDKCAQPLEAVAGTQIKGLKQGIKQAAVPERNKVQAGDPGGERGTEGTPGSIMSLLRVLMVAHPLRSLCGADLKGVFVTRVLQNSCVFLKFSLLKYFAKTSCKTALFCRKRLGRPGRWNARPRFQQVLQQLTRSAVANDSEPCQHWMKTRANFKLILCRMFLLVWPQGAVYRSF